MTGTGSRDVHRSMWRHHRQAAQRRPHVPIIAQTISSSSTSGGGATPGERERRKRQAIAATLEQLRAQNGRPPFPYFDRPRSAAEIRTEWLTLMAMVALTAIVVVLGGQFMRYGRITTDIFGTRTWRTVPSSFDDEDHTQATGKWIPLVGGTLGAAIILLVRGASFPTRAPWRNGYAVAACVALIAVVAALLPRATAEFTDLADLLRQQGLTEQQALTDSWDWLPDEYKWKGLEPGRAAEMQDAARIL